MNSALKSALANFGQRNGELLVGGIPVSAMVKQYATPLYLYDRSILLRRWALLREKLPSDLNINYAVKANPNMKILQELGQLYDGVDVASMGEMKKAMAAGIPPEKMSFAGPGKSIAELHFAVDHGIGSISVESDREIDHIAQICQNVQKQASISIRINPQFELVKSGMKMGGGPKQFGIDSELVPRVLCRFQNQAWLRLEGIHIFSGSQNLDAKAIVAAFDQIVKYAVALAANQKISLATVNMGGGFGIPYFANDHDLDLDTVGTGLRSLLAQARDQLPTTQFSIELGRFIVGECGIYLARILYRKLSRGETFLILDGGLHQHLAASGNFGQSLIRRPMPITVANKLDHPIETVNVVGPLCTPMDTFGMNLELPHAEEGDLVAVMNSGAYGFSASPLGFLSHQPPQELVL